ncbi:MULTISPECIES: hypothetical protein [Pseudomonas]|uniref:Phage tail protein n=1 Tax=Pseudomonas wuhanensis TaxID=2954098 RepID=A0ABY9GVG2_9PSED|nr:MULTISPECIES: hypothetical protein [unclassified Pseudomonas]WLI13881.1 hypothetical protein PSH65_07005 [Pseudomonas sp. FP603]WLI19779.1 hypothetical protein PSH88_07010 [Pseudomonas sp. FP607]
MKDSTDPNLHPLLIVAMYHLLEPSTPPVLWEVGETWVRFDNGKYTIGADEPATYVQVRELLIEADWKAQQWLDD